MGIYNSLLFSSAKESEEYIESNPTMEEDLMSSKLYKDIIIEQKCKSYFGQFYEMFYPDVNDYKGDLSLFNVAMNAVKGDDTNNVIIDILITLENLTKEETTLLLIESLKCNNFIMANTIIKKGLFFVKPCYSYLCYAQDDINILNKEEVIKSWLNLDLIDEDDTISWETVSVCILSTEITNFNYMILVKNVITQEIKDDILKRQDINDELVINAVNYGSCNLLKEVFQKMTYNLELINKCFLEALKIQDMDKIKLVKIYYPTNYHEYVDIAYKMKNKDFLYYCTDNNLKIQSYALELLCKFGNREEITDYTKKYNLSISFDLISKAYHAGNMEVIKSICKKY